MDEAYLTYCTIPYTVVLRLPILNGQDFLDIQHPSVPYLICGSIPENKMHRPPTEGSEENLRQENKNAPR